MFGYKHIFGHFTQRISIYGNACYPIFEAIKGKSFFNKGVDIFPNVSTCKPGKELKTFMGCKLDILFEPMLWKHKV